MNVQLVVLLPELLPVLPELSALDSRLAVRVRRVAFGNVRRQLLEVSRVGGGDVLVPLAELVRVYGVALADVDVLLGNSELGVVNALGVGLVGVDPVHVAGVVQGVPVVPVVRRVGAVDVNVLGTVATRVVPGLVAPLSSVLQVLGVDVANVVVLPVNVTAAVSTVKKEAC